MNVPQWEAALSLLYSIFYLFFQLGIQFGCDFIEVSAKTGMNVEQASPYAYSHPFNAN